MDELEKLLCERGRICYLEAALAYKIYCSEKNTSCDIGTVILLHGNGENSDIFNQMIPALAKSFKVIALDSRGHGDSELGKGVLDFDLMADDLAYVMDRLGVDRSIIVGYSDGGNAALSFGLLYKDRVEKMVIIGANLYPSGMKLRFLVPTVVRWFAEKIGALFSKKLAKKALVTGLMVHYPHIYPKRLNRLDFKTLVIAGEKDVIKKKHTELIASNLGNAKLCIIKGNHDLPKTAAEELAEVIMQNA